MKKCCFTLVLLLMALVAFSATKIEIKTDKSVAAEIDEDKGKQHFKVQLTFLPVTTLDAVSNDEMTEILAQFFAEEALSSYLKRPKTVNFLKVKSSVFEKTKQRCVLSYDIPVTAVSDVKENERRGGEESIKKCFSSVSSNTLLRDFQSTCFHDLRIAEVVFLEKIKTAKNKARLTQKIKAAFSALKKKIYNDDALFLSEKEELLAKTDSVQKFLLKKLSQNVPADSAVKFPGSVVRGHFVPEFEPFLFKDSILLELGGCRAFRTENGKIVLIAVGVADVKDQSAGDRIRRKRIAEHRAFGELAKHDGVEVSYFAERGKTTTVLTKNRQETGESRRTSTSRIRISAETYVSSMITVGQWYSRDGKHFYLAKGAIVSADRTE